MSKLAACALLLGLLLSGSVAVAVARASSQTKTGSTPPGAVGGATSSQATRLETGVSYQGAVNRREPRLWYRLDGAGAKRMVFHVRGRSQTCAVRVSVLDARGRPLAQLITSPDETLPFVVLIPVGKAFRTYYVRFDASPFGPCPNAAYAFTLVEPEQPAACVAPEHQPAESTSKACPTNTATGPRKAPLLTAAPGTAGWATLARTENTCERIGPLLWRATLAVARERRLVFHRRASIWTLRLFEHRRRALARRVYHACTES